jgi:hypothetical protein
MPSCAGFVRAVAVATVATCAHARALGLPPSLGGVVISNNWAVSAGADGALRGFEDAAMFKPTTPTADASPAFSVTFAPQSNYSDDLTNETYFLSAAFTNFGAAVRKAEDSIIVNITTPTMQMAGAAAGAGLPAARTGGSASGTAYQSMFKKLSQERAKLTQQQAKQVSLDREKTGGHHHLKRCAARTREKLIMRDTDIVLVTFPKSKYRRCTARRHGRFAERQVGHCSTSNDVLFLPCSPADSY